MDDTQLDKEQALARLDAILATIKLPTIRRDTRLQPNLRWLSRNIPFADDLSNEGLAEVKKLLRILLTES